MKTRIISTLIIGVLLTLLFSCGTNSENPTDNLDVNLARTEAVATFASSLTKTLVAVPTTSPTLTVEPTSTSLEVTGTVAVTPTANPCYNLLYIEDVTIPDNTQMKAGETFTKTWLVQNIGGCAWKPGFTFQHVGGDLMRGNTVTLTEAIQTGSKREISVQLVVPSGQNGLIQSAWRMADENGNFFGDTLSVNILVGSITPQATNTP
ncbi:MAG: NBR1-Ig-like domain-containing protein [Anaerolineales bacterium]